jgi:transposase InsO family protein
MNREGSRCGEKQEFTPALTPVARVDLEPLRDFILRELLTQRDRDGGLDNAAVADAASRAGVTARTIRRWVARGEVLRRPRGRGLELDDQMLDVLFDCNGNVSVAAQILVERCPELRHPGDDERRYPALRRNLQRVVSRDLSPQARARVRKGARVARNFELREERSREQTEREFQLDFKDMHTYTVDPKTGEIGTLLACFVRDTLSGGIAGVSFCRSEDANAARFALFEAFTRSADRPVGGVPHRLHSDNGPALNEELLGLGLDRLGVVVSRTMRYSPHLNGAVEAFHGALERVVCAVQPGYTRGPRGLDGALDRGEACASPPALLEQRVRDFTDDWNHKWRHQHLGGLTCAEHFLAHGPPSRAIEEHEMLHLLPARRCKVQSRGVAIGTGTRYVSDALWDKVGEQVVVHYLPPDPEVVYIRHGDRFLCEAVPQEGWSDESKKRARGRQRGLTRELEARAHHTRRRSEYVNRAAAQAEQEFDRRERGEPPSVESPLQASGADSSGAAPGSPTGGGERSADVWAQPALAHREPEVLDPSATLDDLVA